MTCENTTKHSMNHVRYKIIGSMPINYFFQYYKNFQTYIILEGICSELTTSSSTVNILLYLLYFLYIYRNNMCPSTCVPSIPPISHLGFFDAFQVADISKYWKNPINISACESLISIEYLSVLFLFEETFIYSEHTNHIQSHSFNKSICIKFKSLLRCGTLPPATNVSLCVNSTQIKTVWRESITNHVYYFSY